MRLQGVWVAVGVTVLVGVGTHPVFGLQAPGHTVSVRWHTLPTHAKVVQALLTPQSAFVRHPGVFVAVDVAVAVGVLVGVDVKVTHCPVPPEQLALNTGTAPGQAPPLGGPQNGPD